MDVNYVFIVEKVSQRLKGSKLKVEGFFKFKSLRFKVKKVQGFTSLEMHRKLRFVLVKINAQFLNAQLETS
jgi:hypothetical protein